MPMAIHMIFRLRLLLKYLNEGETRPVSLAEMQNIISYSADVLNHCSINAGLEVKRYNFKLSSVNKTIRTESLKSSFKSI